jgi:predicted nucleotidyltransferase
MNFLPRDFIETSEGLLFAVVDGTIEDGKVLGFLRYGPGGKLNTAAANALLRDAYPKYLHHSIRLDADLHAVPLAAIARHHLPRQRAAELLRLGATDAIEGKLVRLLTLLLEGGLPAESLGVTGSLLIGRQNRRSDLDVVVYGRGNFFQALARVSALVEAGLLDELDGPAWRDAYDRRACSLSDQEYYWHERRKGNKGLIEGTKFDLALIALEVDEQPQAIWHKTGTAIVQARVLDDTRAYDQPARYSIDHPEIGEVQSFTQTYAGQAKTGETIEAAGKVEASNDGRKRLVVGSNREALGEFIRVIA